jgi:hypothetical protein
MAVDLSSALSKAENAANSLLSTANEFARTAASAFNNVQYPYYNGPFGGGIPFYFQPTPVPQVQITATTPGPAPTAPALAPPAIRAVAGLADFTEQAPTLTLPVRPSGALPGAPTGRPTFNIPAAPGEPPKADVPSPNLASIDVGAAPSVSIDTYHSSIIFEDIDPPTEVFEYAEEKYTSALLDKLTSKLLKDLADGSYGIEPADEVLLWQQAREREQMLQREQMQDVTRQVAARGFQMPPGVLNAMQAAVAQEAGSKQASLSREVMLKRADLYVDNRKFTIQQVRETEQMLITYYGYAQERALNAMKALVDFGVKAYEARLARLNYHLSVAKAEAEQWEMQFKSAMVPLEVWKAELEGTKIASQINVQEVETYKAQWQGAAIALEAHKTKVEYAKLLGELEMMKLQAFGHEVSIYTSQVKAKEAEFGMYEAGIRGENLKLESFRAKAEVYKVRAGAKADEWQAAKAEIDAKTTVMRAQIEGFSAQVEAYKAGAQAQTAFTQAQSAAATATISAVEAANKSAGAAAEANVAANKATADIALGSAQVGAQVAIAAGRQTAAVAEAIANVNMTMAGVYSNAAMAIGNSVAGIGAEIKLTS